MSGDPFDAIDLEGFDGITRLFPLPNVVLFPSAVQLPLHIFEPRYRQMVTDAVETDRLITTILLRPGYEQEYYGNPAVYDVGCIGRIVRHEQLADGRSNLALQGLSRIHIDNEIPTDKLYRTARVTILKDAYPSNKSEDLDSFGSVLRHRLAKLLSLMGESDYAKQQIGSTRQIPVGCLCDLVVHYLNVETAVKQDLLEELNVLQRADLLLAWLDNTLQLLQKRTDGEGTHPPDFSLN